jgi:hypothetical protein
MPTVERRISAHVPADVRRLRRAHYMQPPEGSDRIDSGAWFT